MPDTVTRVVLNAILISGNKVVVVPVVMANKNICVPANENSKLQILNSSEVIGVTLQPPSKSILKSILDCWNSFGINEWMSKNNLRLHVRVTNRSMP